MSKIEKIGKLIESEVLIIGGGISGLWAATRARESVENVLIVDKGPQDWGGLASSAGGDMTVLLPGVNIDDFLQELIYYFDGLCEQDIIEVILRESILRLEDYEKLGHKFVRDNEGNLKGIPQRGLEHIKCCIYRPYGKGGKDMVEVLLEKAKSLGIKRLHRTQITSLLKRDGMVIGAIGFNTITGEFYIFKANSVVLATGDSSWKPSYHVNTATGEGIAMALAAGAEVKNCEFARVWNVPKLFAWEGQTILLPLGAKFINAKGEAFMEKYSPVLGNNTDPHYNVLGMAFEAREGRGPFYLDCSQMKPADIEVTKPNEGWQRLNYEKLKVLGIDFFKDRTEWMPQVMGSYEQIVVDTMWQCYVPGLFIAGIWAPDPGLYIGGWNLCRTAVSGHIAGKTAGINARNHKAVQIDTDEVEALKNTLFAPLNKPGFLPSEVLNKVRDIIFPYDVCILKHERSLKKALNMFEKIKTEILPEMTAPDIHYLMKLVEVKGIASMTERYLRASLMRTESRAGHYREDYPERDNDHWLKWIVVNQQDTEMHMRTEALPFDKYKFKPTRYYMDNFKF